MQLKIPRDYFSQPVAPSVYLCTQSGTIMGELQATDTRLSAKWNSYSEFSFTTSRTYVDMITGETKIHPLFDKIEGPRTVLVAGYGYFVIQDNDATYGDMDSKSISAFSIDYNLSSKYVNSFKINTGEIDSAEVIFEQDKYGASATKDDMYKRANENLYDPKEKYFHRAYNNDHKDYEYKQIQIKDEKDYQTHFGKDVVSENILYIHGYANVKFYDKDEHGLSLLHILFNNIPDWDIADDVDYQLWNKERKISEDRIDIYSLLTTKIADIFECVVVFDTISKKVHFYAEEEDGLKDDGTTDSKYDTDIYISKQNLANEINISMSTDNLKTKLKVSGSDDLNIREVNLDKNYIMNLNYYHSYKEDDDGHQIPDYEWMEQDLFEQYSKYEDAVEEYAPLHEEAVKKWVVAGNTWNELMHHIPVEDGVLKIDDEFKKLYCTYTPIDNAYLKDKETNLTDSFINSRVDTLYLDADRKIEVDKNSLKDGDMFIVQGYGFYYKGNEDEKFKCEHNMFKYNEIALYKKLNLYHVDADIKANKPENILLRLKNDKKDIATIRVYCKFVSAKDDTWNANQFYYTKDKNKEEYYKDYSVTVINFDSKKKDLYKDIYEIQTVITYTDISATSATQNFTLTQWINGDLITETEDEQTVEKPSFNHLAGFQVSAIGELGAYFCLAKQEIQPKKEFNGETYEPTDYLKSFGVRLLEEKETTYLTVFQSQTEHMHSQEKYQCIASDTKPEGIFPDKTRWIKTGSNITELYIYEKPDENAVGKWVGPKEDAGISAEDRANYENYQRYIDNYNKLKAVQEVLAEKKKDAEYWLNGYAVPNRTVNLDKYITRYIEATEYNKDQIYYDIDGKKFDKGVLTKEEFDDGDYYIKFEPSQSLEGDMQRAASEHFGINKELIARVSLNADLPLYTFTKSGDYNFHYTQPIYGYTKGDKWIVGGDYVPPGVDPKYIPATIYIDGEIYYTMELADSYNDKQIYYSSDGEILETQPTSLEEVISMKGHIPKAYVVKASGYNANTIYYNANGVRLYPQPANEAEVVSKNAYVLPKTYVKKAEKYNSGVIYYDISGVRLKQQPINDEEVILMNAHVPLDDYYVFVHALLEAKETKKAGEYSNSDWGDVTTYAVYLKGQTPYVSYSNSRGVYQAWRDYYSNLTELERFFNPDQWKRLSPLIREDEFTDDNFLLNSLESEEERLEICRELRSAAAKELKTLSQPSLEFSMNMANILALKEFEPIVNQFALGNFIRIGLREGLVKKARLLEVSLSFDDLSDFNCVFGNLVSGKSEIDIHAELLSQAISAGSQVAKNSPGWQLGTEKANQLEEDIRNGLADAVLEIGKTNNQSIIWDQYGIWGRKFKDGVDPENAGPDDYEPEQFRMSNNKLIFSNDGFKTSKAMFGKYTINGEERWGPLAEYVTADTIEGKLIKGGSIVIGEEGGTQFIVNTDGSVEIKDGGKDKYVGKAAIDEIDKAYRYTVELVYTGSTVFNSKDASTIVTAIVKDYSKEITHRLPSNAKFKWMINGIEWKTVYMSEGTKPLVGIINNDVVTLTVNQVEIDHSVIAGNSMLSCEVEFDDTKLLEESD